MTKKRKGENIACKACEKLFYVPEYRIKTARFCSLDCQNHKQYEKCKFSCLICRKECIDSPSRKGVRKFCSVECYNIQQTNKKEDQRDKRRLAIMMAREKGQLGNSGPSTRKFAFSKKESKCQICGYLEYKCCLDVHHVDYDPNNNSIENLAILCVICHRKVHRNILIIGDTPRKKSIRKFPRKNDKLDIEKVKEIKALLDKKDMTHKEIASLYEVKRECISKINQGKRWSTKETE